MLPTTAPQGILSEPKETFEIGSAAMIQEDVNEDVNEVVKRKFSPIHRLASLSTVDSWGDGDQIEDDDVDSESRSLWDAPSKDEKKITVKPAPPGTVKFLMDYARDLENEEWLKSLQPVKLSEGRAFAMLTDVLTACKGESFQQQKVKLVANAAAVGATVYVKGFSNIAFTTFQQILPKYGFKRNFQGIIEMKHALKAIVISAMQDESEAEELSRMLKQIDIIPPTIDGYIFDQTTQHDEPDLRHKGAVAWAVPDNSGKQSTKGRKQDPVKPANTITRKFKLSLKAIGIKSAETQEVSISSDVPLKAADVKEALITQLGFDLPSQLEIVTNSDAAGGGGVRRLADSERLEMGLQIMVVPSEKYDSIQASFRPLFKITQVIDNLAKELDVSSHLYDPPLRAA